MFGWDLTIAILVITTLSVSAFCVGRRVNSASYPARPLLFVASVILCLVFSWLYSGNLGWARAMPFSGVLYWSNFMPILLGFTAGVACNTAGFQRMGRPMTIVALSLMAGGYLVVPLARPIVSPVTLETGVSGDRWDDGVCLQSHGSTCAAAAATTLLKLHGVETNERTMVDRCLTSEYGTESLGLYRGLKISSSDTKRSVRVASANPEHWISKSQLPNIALVRFDSNEFSTPQSRHPVRRTLGPRGEGHAVVVLGYQDGRWVIGDPAIGQVTWSDEALRRRFTGEAIYLRR